MGTTILRDQHTGIFRWEVNRRGGARAGEVAGCLCPDGYRRITLYYQLYSAHRLAYFMMMGRWPKYQIDHRNLQKDDNRWINLRLASHSKNQQNQGKAHPNNKLGVLGVSPNGKRFRAQEWQGDSSRDFRHSRGGPRGLFAS